MLWSLKTASCFLQDIQLHDVENGVVCSSYHKFLKKVLQCLQYTDRFYMWLDMQYVLTSFFINAAKTDNLHQNHLSNTKPKSMPKNQSQDAEKEHKMRSRLRLY